jgi:uncharacterized protein YgiM (DUF1202 family)
MHRRLAIVSLVAVALVLAACGSGSATPSPEPSPSAATVATAPPASLASPSQPVASGAPTTTMRAACDGVSLRRKPTTDATVVVRLAAGTKVRVADTVKGDAYTAGNCGKGGDTWLKIDRVAGKGVKSQYGVKYVYAAAGFFK